MTRPTHTERTLRYTFTQAERMERAIESSEAVARRDELEADKKRVVKEYDARITEQEARIALLSEKVRTGYELRLIKCAIEYNVPRVGRKCIGRTDTVEEVEILDMLASEKDEPLPFPEPEPVAKPAASDGFDKPAAPPTDPLGDPDTSFFKHSATSNEFRTAIQLSDLKTLELAVDRTSGTKRKLIEAQIIALKATT